jgi:hypothetical protein
MRIIKLVKSHTPIGALHVLTVRQKPKIEGQTNMFVEDSHSPCLYMSVCMYVMYVYMCFDMTPERRNSGARIDIYC